MSAHAPGGLRSGQALWLGHDVNTDELHPSRFYSLDDQRVRAGFLGAVGEKRVGDAQTLASPVVLAGRNFGVGSSRETGARVFLLAGVQAVVAVSFARIFYRNVSNLGLPALVCPGLQALTPEPGQRVSVDLGRRTVTVGEHELAAEPLDPYWQALADAGGLAAWLGLA